MGFEQPTYTFEEDAGTVDVCVAFLEPAEIDSNVFVDLLGSTTDGTADGEQYSYMAYSICSNYPDFPTTTTTYF